MIEPNNPPLPVAPDVRAAETASSSERRKVIFSVIFAAVPVVLIWLIHVAQDFFNINLRYLVLVPRQLDGLGGILGEPLLHGSYPHLISNTLPLFLLLTGVIYFYRGLGIKVAVLIWLLTGSLVWLFARPSMHVGSSGIVYGLASFIAFSGVIRNDARLMSVSLIIVFLYGSMVWGIFPISPGVSWESHLMGALSGLFCAVYYRKEGPQPRQYFEEEEEEQGDEPTGGDPGTPGQIHSTGGNIEIRYHYRPGSSDETP